jgi:hypothetical protein
MISHYFTRERKFWAQFSPPFAAALLERFVRPFADKLAILYHATARRLNFFACL